jgi:hypothetical protein
MEAAKKIHVLKQAEKEIIAEFKNRFALVERSKFEILAYAQHHGAPTRLLDWSRNPLAALWFAVSEKEADSESGVVYQIRVIPERGVCMTDDYELDFCDGGKCKQPIHILPSPSFISRTDRQRSAFSIVTLTDDLAFKPLDEIAPTCIRKFVIPQNLKAGIRRLLTEIGIDPFTLFGTPDSVGKSWALRLDYSDLNITPPTNAV